LHGGRSVYTGTAINNGAGWPYETSFAGLNGTRHDVTWVLIHIEVFESEAVSEFVSDDSHEVNHSRWYCFGGISDKPAESHGIVIEYDVVIVSESEMSTVAEVFDDDRGA
jgi:hypothetical protein